MQGLKQVLSLFNIMFPVNIVGSPLSRKCSIICVITSSSQVMIYQAVLLRVPLNQGCEIFPSCLRVPKIKGKCLNIFLLFHSGLGCQNMLFLLLVYFVSWTGLMVKRHSKIQLPFFIIASTDLQVSQQLFFAALCNLY